MNILIWIGIVWGILELTGIGVYFYDGYKYPVCPECGNNRECKRTKGKNICKVHGEISR